MPVFVTEYPQFFTASIKGWYKLLEHDHYKDIVINSLRFLVENKRIKLYAFFIMSDHFHLIRQMQPLNSSAGCTIIFFRTPRWVFFTHRTEGGSSCLFWEMIYNSVAGEKDQQLLKIRKFDTWQKLRK